MDRFSLLLVALALVAVGAAGTATAEEVEDPTGNVCVNPTGTAECGLAAASATGKSDAFLAASGTGDASGIVAASGTGDAAGYDLAVSARGEATCDTTCYAASGTGDAAAEDAAVSVTGDATSHAEDCAVRATIFGEGAGPGCLAVSGTGDAATATGSCDLGVPMAELSGCVAVSGTGEAESDGYDLSGCEVVQDQAGAEVACLGVPEDVLP